MLIIEYTPTTNIKNDTPIDRTLVLSKAILSTDIAAFLKAGSATLVSKWDKLEWDAMQVANAKEMRKRRNELLASTDWYGASDVVMPPAIKAWRQAMRDITLDPAFPNVSFPAMPVL